MRPLIIIIVSVLILLGCSKEITRKNDANVIRIKGSTTMLLLTKRLAAEYMHEHPGVSIYVSGGGTSAGFKALSEGEADICMASRNLKPKEIQILAEKYEKVGMSFLVAKDALSIYLNPSNQVTDLKINELRKIFTGGINNWKKLGGRDKEIIPVVRPENSGTHEYFKQLVMENEDYTSDAVVKNTNRQMLEEVTGNDGSIGYGGIAFKGFVAYAKINGIAPTEENIRNDTYPITRYLHFYTVQTPRGPAKGFINWVMSSRGQKIIREFGYISLW
mgnify:CR=1 FL=1